MSSGMQFVLAIILITTIGSIIRARYSGRHEQRDERGRGHRRSRFGMTRGADDDDRYGDDNVETARLKDEVRSLKDRIATLERITVEKESSLNREIDSLRDR